MPASVPIVDLRKGTDDELGRQLVEAYRTMGFCSIVGHGVDPIPWNAAKAFFARTDKDDFAYQGHRSNTGYIRMGRESHDMAKMMDRKETMDIGESDDMEWPPGLREPMLQYFEDCFRLNLRLLAFIEIGLGLDSGFLVKRCDGRHCNLRLLHYPELPRATEDIVVRGTRHTDFGTLTLLQQDGVGGLRVEDLDGQWVMVEPVPDAFVVNVGEMLQRWTNDRLRATPHQVVNPPGGVVPERYSIAFFCNANKEVLLECITQDGEVAKYPPVNAFDYLTQRLQDTIKG